MKTIYFIFGPVIGVYCKIFGTNEEVILARVYKKRVNRGDDVSEEHIKAYEKYKDHPMVKNYKW